MNHFDVQQNALVVREETRLALFSDRRETLFCPKPRRIGSLINNPIRHLRCHMSHEAELSESTKRADLLDTILMKEGSCTEPSMTLMASSPPSFFCGSPPSRSANPLVKDARFGDEKVSPLSPLPLPSSSGLLSSSSSARTGGCARAKSGLKPAAVRVEGFDCLNRDRQNSSIPAVA